jgi:hypothetical protein
MEVIMFYKLILAKLILITSIYSAPFDKIGMVIPSDIVSAKVHKDGTSEIKTTDDTIFLTLKEGIKVGKSITGKTILIIDLELTKIITLKALDKQEYKY